MLHAEAATAANGRPAVTLEWPPEMVTGEAEIESWYQPASNHVLDFHGDPIKAGLRVFSDGNHHMALRYTRIFPGLFDIVALGGTPSNPEPPPENLTAEFHMGLVHGGGEWGERFMVFMQEEAAADIYRQHGLVHQRDFPD